VSSFTKQYRAIWISDTHLGTRGCKSGFLLDFLRSCESEYLYLVGDIIDGWQLKKSWYWPQAHNDVVQKVLRKVRKGTQVYYIPGNHDAAFREYAGMQFGGISVVQEVVHETADGRRLLVLHGDQFDGVMQYTPWLAYLGDGAYTFTLWLNQIFNQWRGKLGYPYWSLSAYLKHKVKNAVSFISSYEKAIADEARRRKVDGVVCGHIHHPEVRQIDGIWYYNDGDWVESCTALVETWDGSLQILHWADYPQALPSLLETAAEAELEPVALSTDEVLQTAETQGQ